MKTSNRILWVGIIGLLVAFLVIMLSYRLSNRGIDEGNVLSMLANWQSSSQVVKGDGYPVLKSYPLTSFDKIKVAGWFDVTVKRGEKPSAEITLDSNILPYIEADVNNNTLLIKVANGINAKPAKIGKIVITTPEVKTLSMAGRVELNALDLQGDVVNINLAGQSNAISSGSMKHLYVNLAGNSSFNGKDLHSEVIKLQMAGDSKVHMSGQVDQFKLRSGGSLELNAGSLIAKDVVLEGGANHQITVNAQQTLTVRLVGDNIVKYLGEPKTINNLSAGKTVVERVK